MAYEGNSMAFVCRALLGAKCRRIGRRFTLDRYWTILWDTTVLAPPTLTHNYRWPPQREMHFLLRMPFPGLSQ